MPTAIAVNTAKIMGADWLRANPTAVPRKGAEHGVAISVAKSPEARCPGRPCFGPESANLARLLRQRYLEDAPQIQAEEQDDDRQDRHEDRLLELDTPAHGTAGRLGDYRRQSQGPEGKQDTQRCCQRSENHVRSAVASALDETKDLQGENGQHARHRIQDEATDQAEQENDGKIGGACRVLRNGILSGGKDRIRRRLASGSNRQHHRLRGGHGRQTRAIVTGLIGQGNLERPLAFRCACWDVDWRDDGHPPLVDRDGLVREGKGLHLAGREDDLGLEPAFGETDTEVGADEVVESRLVAIGMPVGIDFHLGGQGGGGACAICSSIQDDL